MDPQRESQVADSEQSAQELMELQEFAHSPNFPRRKVETQSSTPLTYFNRSHESSPSCTESFQTSEEGGSSDKSQGGWLHFNPLDRLGWGKKPSSESYSTPILKVGSGSRKGESQIEKDDKVYTVATKDITMLERISQRARERIRKHHEVFVELEEIRMDPSDELEWAETAHWIKFEEEVEEGSGKWGRPHISALAFHSLVELKKGLDEGCVLLDLEADTFPDMVDQLVAGLVHHGSLPLHCSQQVRTLLHKKHKHTKYEEGLWAKIKNSATDGTLHHIGEGLRRKGSVDQTSLPVEGGPAFLERKGTMSQLPLMLEEELPGSSPSNSTPNSVPPTTFVPPSSTVSKKVSFSHDNNSHTFSTQDHTSHKENSPTGLVSQYSSNQNTKEITAAQDSTPLRLAKRRGGGSIISVIPDEAESLTVLVGGVNFLTEPITAFVRLNESLLHRDLMEAPVPVRFLFLLIGPIDGRTDYHEVGRAMATLMSDAHFHEVAYLANSKEDLIKGMDEFLDNSLVLPPGDWGEDLLLPAIHERHNLRQRKEEHKQDVEQYRKRVTDPIKHSRRPFGGIWRDLKNFASRYISDYRDALDLQVLISILFLYISFLAPAIAFGGLMEEITFNFIGGTETLFATGLGGIVYGLFAVQPLTVLAFTGPVLVFESIIFDFSEMLNIPYIEWRAMTGLWMMLILLILAASELTFLVHHFSRFSEEIFTGVVALFFLWEACVNIFHTFERNPLCGLHYPCGEAAHLSNVCISLTGHHDDNHSNSMLMKMGMDNHSNSMLMKMGMDNYSNSSMMDNHSMPHNEVTPTLPRGFRICNQPNTALWTLMLAVGTFIVALLLRKLRYKNFLGKKTRRLVSDFGMLTAITTMVLLAFLFRNVIAVEYLEVPPNYSVTRPMDRKWFVNPFDGSLSLATGFGAIIPALLLSILIFVENQLALILVNKPEHKLTKPVGYHLDLSLVALLSGVCGLLGSPFLCGAPVRSIQHLQTLSVFTKKHAPGEKPRLLRVHEQRVATIVVHVLIIFTPFAYKVLGNIPIPVILGVFFYLTYASIGGVQLFTRIKLLFILPKHHPDVIYVRKVRAWKMHIYTLIQVLIVALLYALKLSPAAMIYPLMIVLLIPLRKLLGKTLYSKEEIEALDNEENAKPEGHTEISEFAMTHIPY